MFKVGETEPTDVKIGGTQVSSIYLGEKEIWTYGKAIYLGNGKSFNVASVYPKYSELTVDDFFVTPYNGTLLQEQYSGIWQEDGSYKCKDFSDSISFSKSYNASTGVLTCSYGGVNVDVWVIPNSAKMIEKGKIISLGDGTSWNVSSKPKYDKATANNFLFRTLPYRESHYVCCASGCENWIGFSKSYNSGTGVLNAQTSVRRLSDQNDNVSPYYISPSILK